MALVFDDKSKLQIDSELSPFVFVDYLAFTFSFVDLKHAHESNLSSLFWAPMPSYADELQVKLAKSPEQRAKLEQRYISLFDSALYQRLVVFCADVLGLKLSNWRQKGLNGYADSAHLHAFDSKEHLGFVALGGNNDTCYIQLEGKGCKALFSHTSFFRLHWWLTNILNVTHLSRIDLTVDDFNNLFDRKYASLAFRDGGFRTSKRGLSPRGGSRIITTAAGKIVNESFEVGSRQSAIYWRIYNKAAQLDLSISWFRVEVELKKIHIDVLLDISGYFAGICDFSASIISNPSFKLPVIEKIVSIDFNQKIKWLRKQAGRSLFKLSVFFDGDLKKLFGLLCPRDLVEQYNDSDDCFLPDHYKSILNEILRV